MKKKYLLIIFSIIPVCVFLLCGILQAYTIPWINTKVHYFYVFGKEGNPFLGAEDNELTLYFEIPSTEKEITISVFDPNTGGMRDWRTNSDNPWDTVTEFSVYGKKLLDKKTFKDKGYDRKFYVFGPYKKEKGIKAGNFYKFKLVVKGLKGDDQNLFKVDIKPESVKSYCYDITLRLLPHKGDKMYFFPEIPKNMSKITIENYDIDDTGANSWLYDLVSKKEYPIKDSTSSQWQKTTVEIEPKEKKERLTYVIEKATQRYANAGLRFKDGKGNPIPIFFRQAYISENTFIFDAGKSYDPDDNNLSFYWDFGDGNKASGVKVKHTYSLKGTYTVTLTVKDDSGMKCDTAVKKHVIKIK